MTEESLPFHALANIFPLLEGVQFRDLVEDIRLNGLREPIVLHDGSILDGRNRYRACPAAQVSARFKTFEGNNPLAFVVSANLHRRHLDTSQRAIIAAEIAERRHRGPLAKDGRRGRSGNLVSYELKHPERNHANRAEFVSVGKPERPSVAEAAELLNVSDASVRHAAHVLSSGVPELIAAVKGGAASVSAARDLASLPKDQQSQVMKAGGAEAVSVIGRQAHSSRLERRRINRAAENASDHAVFDHVKVRDGRSLGNVRIGELRTLIDAATREAALLEAVLNHYSNADSLARVRDVFTPAKLSAVIESVVRDSRQEAS